MAKKRPREEDFSPPPFDEVNYMKREREGAKAAVVTILLAITMAVVSTLLSIGGVWPVGLLLIFVVPFTLKRLLPMAGVDLTTFDRKTWATMVAVLVMAWVSLWILFLNPPFVDSTPPVIRAVFLEPSGGRPVAVERDGATLSLPGVSSLNVVAYIPDSDPVSAQFVVELQDSPTQTKPVACDSGSSRCVLPLSGLLPNKSVTITITARDAQGHPAPEPWTFSFVVT